MPSILIFGEGNLIETIIKHLFKKTVNVRITVASREKELEKLIILYPLLSVVSADLGSNQEIDFVVSKHDVIVSILKQSEQKKITQSAIKFKKNVISTAYLDKNILDLNKQYFF